jgi:cation transport protein ChaC
MLHAVLHEPILPDLVVRDPQEALHRLRQEWPATAERWVFGYASLIWRPEFDAAERRPALLHGWHRALRMRSRVNRGTPDRPGLVFALLRGGACRGVVYRMRPEHAESELDALWAREQPTGVYDARILRCRTDAGPVAALAFTLARASPACLPPLSEGQMLDILRHATGRFGSTLQYLAQTAAALHSEGIRDREIERLMDLARRHGLA